MTDSKTTIQQSNECWRCEQRNGNMDQKDRYPCHHLGKYAEELAAVFYTAKMPDGKWHSIPRNAKASYINAMQSVLDHLENKLAEEDADDEDDIERHNEYGDHGDE